MSASVGSRRAGSKAWGVWGAVAVVLLLSVSPANAQGGTFTDKRDGKTYRTAVIGQQTWMAENLNFKMGKSVCYNNADSNCTKYGRLYDWDDAMTACPAGWRLPNDKDWDVLAVAVGGVRNEDGYWEGASEELKSKSGWNENGNGTDYYGFSALPGGSRWSDGRFANAGNYGLWWSAADVGATSARYRYMYYYYTYVGWLYNIKTTLYSVRCVM